MPTKRQFMTEMVQAGKVVMAVINPQGAGVVVPDNLRSSHSLRLNFNQEPGQRGLSLSHWGIREQLRFHGSYQLVAVPWASVVGFVVVNEDGSFRLSFAFDEEPPATQAESAEERVARARERLNQKKWRN